MTAKLFSKVVETFYTPVTVDESSSCSASSPTLGTVS